MTLRTLATILATSLSAITLTGAEKKASGWAVPEKIDILLDVYCYSCHDEDKQKGDIRLDQLTTHSLDTRLGLLNKIQEQLFFEEMPPKKKKSQPTTEERTALIEWVSSELKQHDASRLSETLKRPEFGNYVDHNKLFSGEYKNLPGFTRDRRWLVSEFIFNAKINQLIDHPSSRTIDGKRRTVIGDNGVTLNTRFGGGSLRQSITNPFLLPDNIGVRYYDTTALTGGHLLTMISNAKKIAAHMSSEPVMKSRYPAMYQIMKMELEHRDILASRERFLTSHIKKVTQDLYQESHEALLPTFVREQVEEVPEFTDGKGNLTKRNNVGLLARYEPQDLRAIYLGVGMYKRDNITFEDVIEKCERDWFAFGIHEKRIRMRINIMKVLDKQWDMALIYGDIKKKNYQPEPYKPRSDTEMKIIETAIRKHRKQDDRYSQIIQKCMADWDASFQAERTAAGQAGKKQIAELVDELFLKILEREPTAQEAQENMALAENYMQSLSNQQAIAKLIETLILSSELAYRSEFGQGPADKHGRRMMSPRDASYALAYALTDSAPDQELVAAVKDGRLNTRDDYRREVTRMLKRRDQYYVIDETVQKAGFNSSITNTPIRKLRFFREFFGYTKAMTLFKDDARLSNATSYDNVKGRLVDEADMLVDHILQQDKNVFEELLTTEKFYVYHTGDNAAMKAASDRLRTIYDYFKDKDWENFTEEQLYSHWDFIDKMKMRGTVFPDFINNEKRRKSYVRSFKTHMKSYVFRFGKGQKDAAPYDSSNMAFWHKGNAATRTGQQMRGEHVGRLFNIDYANWDYPTTQPAKVANRKGMLTHPAWLIAHSLNLENDPVRRGKWVREKLLAGTIPDVPISVDAVIPEDHHKTLRQRLEKKTGEEYCWKCHQQMDPLGLPFEIYDDFGRFRKQERIEHPENLIKEAPKERGLHLDGRATYKTLPVVANGVLAGTDDPALDGEVSDAIDLVGRLAKAAKVRQSIIRHAFRYFMGRNEVLSDSKTLIDAERAYLDNEGSFDAVIISLLTSDSFIYRKSTTK